MKDPLRYAIDEGFLAFYAYTDAEGDLSYFARIVNDYAKFFKKDSSTSPAALLVTLPGWDDVWYTMDYDFFMDYGKMYATEQLADADANEFSKVMADAIIEFRYSRKDLIGA